MLMYCLLFKDLLHEMQRERAALVQELVVKQQEFEIFRLVTEEEYSLSYLCLYLYVYKCTIKRHDTWIHTSKSTLTSLSNL